MASSSAFPFPKTPAEWEDARLRTSLQVSSIHDGRYTNSASEMTWPQFILLRVLYEDASEAIKLEKKPTALLRNSDCLARAQGYLASNPVWQAYLADIPSETKPSNRPFPDLGMFSLVRYYQTLSAEVPLHPADSEQPKVVYTNVRTRSMAAAASADPFHTPTKQLANSMSFLELSGSDDQPSSSGPPQPSSQRATLTPYSPISADQAHMFAACRDEQIVNTALILFLNALTIRPESIRGDWSLHRHPFVFKNSGGAKIFEARVDGYLHKHSTRDILAIVEVKPFLRSTALKKIKMQEAAQLAVWIHQSPPTKAEYRADGNVRRLLLAQDRHEIYVTTATFDSGYVDYILGKVQSSTSFLKLKEFGPFTTNHRKQMQFLGEIMLAFSLQECE